MTYPDCVVLPFCHGSYCFGSYSRGQWRDTRGHKLSVQGWIESGERRYCEEAR